MHLTNLRKVGGSVMLAVPPSLLDSLGLQAGAKVSLVVQSGNLIVEPQRLPKYTLKELLAQCKPNARRSEEERDWLNDRPVGGELL